MDTPATKCIGLLGGMSWESTLTYYKLLNEGIKKALGGLHSARIVMSSIDFGPVEAAMREQRWNDVGRFLTQEALKLQTAGADCIVIATNTMHKLVPVIQPTLRIPILHIADATAMEAKRLGIQTLGLLGTRYTMEGDFISGWLTEKHGIRVVTPEKSDRDIVNRVIFEELVLGIVKEDSRKEYARIAAELNKKGAGGLILGCTEIGMLVKEVPWGAPLDTALLHVKYTLEFALNRAKL
eukprot:TRINITY_DN95277_c0_g1_i1.p1 TRINITY_DN95277_c0_g1~~TRINITY_DN95277_c0_g1_i1.p1  ORF type:complete len:239 (+),score=17.78 TRINITY_DN95277_c0_g1_i1:22-738(+)